MLSLPIMEIDQKKNHLNTKHCVEKKNQIDNEPLSGTRCSVCEMILENEAMWNSDAKQTVEVLNRDVI